ncbi:MAG: Smr/MutS family protein [Burkholderiaceae bacterium]|nr:Smr/MutS family protein [Burkholderiaceae bacterium]
MTRKPLKTLGELAALREQLAAAERARAEQAQRDAAAAAKQRAAEASFRREMEALAVEPLQPHGRHHRKPAHPAPHPVSRKRDDAEVLQASVSDDIDVESLLDTDDSLSYRANGIGPDVLRKLRRGEWSIQSEIDLHGHRVDEAREALVAFLKNALKRNQRCVRVVHGKGLGSQGKTPVLKGKVRAWLVQREEVIAFCQARPAEGGSGALVVLLRPTGNAGPDKPA